jgi:hypothetical protein
MKRNVSLARKFWTVGCGIILSLGAAAPVLAQVDRTLNVGGVEDPSGGTIKGTVKFAGKIIPQHEIDTSGNDYCASVHKDNPLLNQKYVFGDNGTLQNVFVYVSKGLEGKTFPEPAWKPVIEQEGCSYTPHVQGILVNQDLTIHNGDDTLHNVQVSPSNNPPFNEAMPVKGMTLEKKFAHAEMPIIFKCAVHNWMTAYVMVMTNPFFAVTQKDGTFEIKGLPPGEYELSFWHELPVFQPDQDHITVKVEAGKTSEVTVTYAPKKKAA